MKVIQSIYNILRNINLNLFIIATIIIYSTACENNNVDRKKEKTNNSKALEIRNGYKDILLDEKIEKFNNIIIYSSPEWFIDKNYKQHEAPNILNYKIEVVEKYSFIGSTKISKIELTTIYGKIKQINLRCAGSNILEEFVHIYGSNYSKNSINQRGIDVVGEKILFSYRWQSVNNYLYLIKHMGTKSRKPGPDGFPRAYNYTYYEVIYEKRTTNGRILEIIYKERQRLNTKNLDEAVKNF